MHRSSPRQWQNWSGSVRCDPHHLSYPGTLEQIQAEVLRVAEEGERLRVIGSGHSFSPLCWSDENLMSLQHFCGLESVDSERRRVWVRGGTTIRQLGALLAEHNLALQVLGDIDRQTLAGAISTGTHGSGGAFGSLSTQVLALRLVLANGTVREVSAESDRDLFDAARLSLGMLGVITHVQLQCTDAYRLHHRSCKAGLGETLARLDEHLRNHRHFEFFWFPYTDRVQLKFSDETALPETSIAPAAMAKELLIENGAFWLLCELTRRVPALSRRASRLAARVAPGIDRVRDARHACAAHRLVRFNETEYGVPVARLPTVLQQIDRLLKALRLRVHFPLHLRFARGDDIWLSPSYQRDTAYVAAYVYRGAPYEDYFAALAEIFDRNEGRPHWAKLHDKALHNLVPLYPRFDDFSRVRDRLDPRGLFINPHLAEMFGLETR